jgi:predicted 3-demethylubiquinone-9 3-methyltransferase (glyoxalase superfamily)
MKPSIHDIKPCLWFDNQGKEAAEFYCSLFDDSKVTSNNALVTEFELAGQKFMNLNGGPMFQINPSISLFVVCEEVDEINSLWEKLLDGGSVMMPLDKYDWSERYGWLKDKFGMTWQIYKGKLSEVNSKITPSLLFTDTQFGNADSAVKFYTSVFPNSAVDGIMYYGKGDPQTAGKVMHAQFVLDGKVFMAMDGPGEHKFVFNEGVSFVVSCKDQEEIDYFWNKLTEGGEESQCGWLKDKFGVSWQIVPAVLGELMSDPERSERVVQAFMKMKKFDIEKLLNA